MEGNFICSVGQFIDDGLSNDAEIKWVTSVGIMPHPCELNTWYDVIEETGKCCYGIIESTYNATITFSYTTFIINDGREYPGWLIFKQDYNVNGFSTKCYYKWTGSIIQARVENAHSWSRGAAIHYQLW